MAAAVLGLLTACAPFTLDKRLEPGPGMAPPPAPRELVLAERGEARAVIVTADAPNPIVNLAVRELAEHVKLATGVELPVVTESAAPGAGDTVRIFIGQTQAARAKGLETESLAPDAFRLVVGTDAVYVLGKENPERGYYSRLGRLGGLNGTLYGVYEIIDRALDVRWLWPGELGTFVPARERVALPLTDETVEMALKIRDFRIVHIERAVNNLPDVRPLGFTEKGLRGYWRDLQVFMRRHRLGRSVSMQDYNPGHYFEGWWERYGKDHPEWFMMNAEGERVGPAMCPSNPSLAEYIVNEVWDGQSRNIRLGEVDVRVYCHCPECWAWDAPVPEGWPTSGPSRPITNRYALFTTRVRDLARARNPEADFHVSNWAYFNYFHEPTIDIDMSGTLTCFVPWGSGFEQYYPMTDKQHQQLMTTWSGWARTGTTMTYRPNYLLHGYVMPHLSTWQAGEMFRHAAANGAFLVDFDSLWAQWAVQGPMLYMHMRLASDPTREVADLRREYFEGFGPAAKPVEAYFDYWEAYASPEGKGRTGVQYNTAERTRLLYPEESFVPAWGFLDEARQAAAADPNPVYAERVAFLEVGLRHAELAAAFIGTLRNGNRAPIHDAEQFAASRQALQELIAFRRAHEHLNFSDLVATGNPERPSALRIEELFDENFVVQPGAKSRLAQPWEGWVFRRDTENQGVEGNWFRSDARASGIGNMDDGEGQSFTFDPAQWTPIRVPARLAETPVGDYLGYGWYATSFVAPEGMAGQPAVLHFDGVDEQAWVYLNGRLIGEHTVESEGKPIGQLWDRPFTITVPAGLIHGNGRNLLVVRTHASAGAAGIWREVGLGAPESE